MSRGHGRVQQVVLALIEAEPEGAWETSVICAQVYRGANRVEKKHRVAVSRALRKTSLPETWDIRYGGRQGGEHVLYNRLSLESTSRCLWLALFGRRHCTYEKFCEFYSHQVDNARTEVAEYRRYFEADEIGRLDIRIAAQRKRAGLARMIGANAEFYRSIAENIKALTEQKAALEAERLSVSSTSESGTGNTYEGKAA